MKAARMSSMPAIHSRPHTQACLQVAHKQADGRVSSLQAVAVAGPAAVTELHGRRNLVPCIVHSPSQTFKECASARTALGKSDSMADMPPPAVKLTSEQGQPLCLAPAINASWPSAACRVPWELHMAPQNANAPSQTSHLSTGEIYLIACRGASSTNSHNRLNDAVACGRLPGQAARPGGALLPGPPPAAAQPASTTLHAQPAGWRRQSAGLAQGTSPGSGRGWWPHL